MTKKSNPEKGKNEKIVNRYHPTNNFLLFQTTELHYL